MAGRGTDILLGGNPEFIAKKQMKKEKCRTELWRPYEGCQKASGSCAQHMANM